MKGFIMTKMTDEMLDVLHEIETKPFQHILPQVNKLKHLLEKGICDVNAKNSDGNTLLHIAVKSGNLRGHNTVQYKTEQEGGPTPENVFDIAYLTAHFEPNPFIKNNQGMTPGMLAAHLKLTSAWQFLSSYERVYEAKCQAMILNAIYEDQIRMQDTNLYVLWDNIKRLRGQHTRD